MCGDKSININSPKLGRIELKFLALWQGQDLLVALTGGRAHIGCVAICAPGAESNLLEFPGHREGEIAGPMAQALASGLNRNVVVAAGIHYDQITKSEIATVKSLAQLLTEAFLARGDEMLTLDDLEGFEKYIKSGRLEAKFRCDSEPERIKTLELLEKLMDVADLADEAATRLIFRGMGAKGNTQQDS